MAEVAFREWLSTAPEAVAVDTETHGVGFYDEAFCATIAWRDDRGVQSHYLEFDEDETGSGHRFLSEILAETPKLVFHNAKFDLQKLILSGIISRDEITPSRIEDT